MLKHSSSGVEVVDDFADYRAISLREWIPRLARSEGEYVARERCRTRRLRRD